MNLIAKMEEYSQRRREEKSEKIRMKNLKTGKKPTKGWGKMVDTGYGGLNSLTNSSEISKYFSAESDIKGFIAEEKNASEKSS
ncbi:TPA: hypothetical protein ACQQMB_002041 [Enterococcus hirae]